MSLNVSDKLRLSSIDGREEEESSREESRVEESRLDGMETFPSSCGRFEQEIVLGKDSS